MLKIEEIQKIREEDQKTIGKINSIADGIVGARMDKIRKKAQNLKDKIQELIDKKGEIFSAPRSKNETLELAIDGFKENRKKFFFEEFLEPHLKDCQSGRLTFLHPDSLRVHLFTDRNIWRLAYLIISEEDIRKAAEALPDIGLSEAERAIQIKKLDSEIAALEEQVEKELKNL